MAQSIREFKLQTSPNRWSCLPTAFAMTLGVPVGNLIKWLGHDGGQIVRPEVEPPGRYLGFHVQELIDYCWWLGYAVTPLEANPRSQVDEGRVARIQLPGGNVNRMIQALKGNMGVLTGQAVASGNHHAVAWDGTHIYDPVGSIKPLDSFAINTFWRTTPR